MNEDDAHDHVSIRNTYTTGRSTIEEERELNRLTHCQSLCNHIQAPQVAPVDEEVTEEVEDAEEDAEEDADEVDEENEETEDEN